MNSNATNKNRTSPKRVRTQDPEDEPQALTTPPSSSPSLPTKAAKRYSRIGSSVAPYKPTTPNHPFWPQDHHGPLQMICQRIDRTMNVTKQILHPTLRQSL